MKAKLKSMSMVLALLALTTLATQVNAANSLPDSIINLNTATVEQLTTLPGIGASKAGAIVKYRSKNPFVAKEDIMNVRGVGEKLFAKIQNNITVSGAKPGAAAKK